MASSSHDESQTGLLSWVPGAEPSRGWGLRNLPFGVAELPSGAVVCVSRVGDSVVDLSALAAAGALPAPGARALAGAATLNAFMALGRPAWRAVRGALQALYGAAAAAAPGPHADAARAALHPAAAAAMRLPAAVGDYTDFYSSKDHAYNMGCMIRTPATALQPNWLWLPVGYHGRASSLVVSGTPVRRPCGQVAVDAADAAKGALYSPCKRLDFELEVATWVGPGTELGDAVAANDAEAHIFGFSLMNDWSARDFQTWEYVPLGPFTSKNFATSVSPWVVTLDALEPFRCATSSGAQEPPPLPYLADARYGSWDVALDVAIAPAGGGAPARVSRSNFKHMYWTARQQLAHHTVSGCNLRPGDVLGSGTVSGPTPDARGCLMELNWKGTTPVVLAPAADDGATPAVTRTWLLDGDAVVMTGACEDAATGERVAWGECAGVVLPAKPLLV